MPVTEKVLVELIEATAERAREEGRSQVRPIEGYRTLVEYSENQAALAETVGMVFNGVWKELARHLSKWGEQYHDIPTWNMITAEEYGEMVAEGNAISFGDARHDEFLKEGIEMIACAIQMLHEARSQKEAKENGTARAVVYSAQNTPAATSG